MRFRLELAFTPPVLWSRAVSLRGPVKRHQNFGIFWHDRFGTPPDTHPHSVPKSPLCRIVFCHVRTVYPRIA